MAKEDLYTPGCIRTVTGQYVNVFDPDPATLFVEDIAHALSHLPRFGGHLPRFYSVAQHSIHVAELVPPEHRLAALMHDASEAYLLDLPSPIKHRLPDYIAAEDRLMHTLAKRFGFSWPMPEEVKHADRTMLEREWNELMLMRGDGTEPMLVHVQPLRERLQPWRRVGYTAEQFIRQFQDLHWALHQQPNDHLVSPTA